MTMSRFSRKGDFFTFTRARCRYLRLTHPRKIISDDYND